MGNRLNHLFHINVLRRGLIVPCSECERRAFYRIELLSESSTCPRCGAPADMTAARRSEREEPEWFYDLHGAVRELLEQNGDVPFLAGFTLLRLIGFSSAEATNRHPRKCDRAVGNYGPRAGPMRLEAPSPRSVDMSCRNPLAHAIG